MSDPSALAVGFGGVIGAAGYWLSAQASGPHPDEGRRPQPVAALAAGALGALASARVPTAWAVPAIAGFTGAAVALGEIDLAELRIPRRVVFGACGGGVLALTVAAAAAGRWWSLPVAAATAAATFGLFLVFHLLAPDGFGYGDVRMGAMCGLFCGWIGWRVALDAVLFASLLAGGTGMALLLLRRTSRRSKLPFGPFLAAGAIVAIVLA